jgi:biotin transport system substrate-specific component
MLMGMVIIHIGGVAWLTVAFTHSLGAAIGAGSLQFLVVDLAKAIVAAMVLPQAWRVVGRTDGAPNA